MRHRLGIFALLAALLIAAAFWLAAPDADHTALAVGPGAPNQMALDADADTPGIQTTRTVSGTGTFRVGVHVTQISQPYSLYQWSVLFPTGTGFSGGVVENIAGTGLTACNHFDSVVPPGNHVYGGCFQVPATSTFLGQTTSLLMHCAAEGTYTIQLLDLVEQPTFGSHLTGGGPGLPLLDTGTSDLSIECDSIAAPPTQTTVPSPTPTATARPDASNIVSLDASPDLAGIQAARVVAGSDPFTVAVAVTSVGSIPYRGYDLELELTVAELTFGGAFNHVTTGTGFNACSGPVVFTETSPSSVGPPHTPGTIRVYGGCIKLGFPPGVAGATTFTGEILQFDLSCESLGTFDVLLLPDAYDPVLGTKLLTFDGSTIPTTTTNITITCVDPPTATPTATATATATATPTAAGPAIEGFAKDADITAVDADPIGNLWICKGAGFPADFTAPDADLPPGQTNCNELIIGEFLRVGPDRDTCNDDDDRDGVPCETLTSENYIPGQTACCDPDEQPEGIGAWELQIKYDHKLFQQPIATCEQGPFGTRSVQPQVSVITENWSLFGCVSKSEPQGQDQIPFVPGADGFNGYASFVTLTIQPDLFQRLRPTKDNGVVTDLLDENCEVADAFGMPWPNSVQGGLLPDCRDVTITIRMLEGDINLDCAVDLADDQEIAFRYGAFFGNLLYNKFYDLEPNLAPDFDIDIKDLQTVFGRNGSTCASPIPDQDPQSAVPDP